nr:MAG TPA: hypothetical protein [Caudoviricetes sp.]
MQHPRNVGNSSVLKVRECHFNPHSIVNINKGKDE